MQVVEAGLRCGGAAHALQHLELWTASLTGAARWRSPSTIDAARLQAPSSHSDVHMHDCEAHTGVGVVRSLQMEREESLLWATLRALGDGDCAAGLATSPKVCLRPLCPRSL